MKKEIAFFDFDGTLTTKDSFLEFIRFVFGTRRFLAGMLLNAPFLVLLKLKLYPRQRAKERVIAHFFGGWKMEDFSAACARFAEEDIPRMLRPGALEAIRELQGRGAEVVVVSASPEHWIKCWGTDHGIEVIGTRLELKEGRITGRLEGRNCHGHEKVARIRAQYRLEEYGPIHAYGDTSGDLPMFAIATQTTYRPFRNS